jgi:hypothetical protein
MQPTYTHRGAFGQIRPQSEDGAGLETVTTAAPIGGVHWGHAMHEAPPEIFMNTLDYAEPIATIEQFKAALLATRDWNGIAPIQLQMIQAQCRAPGSTISPSQMAERLRLKSASAARLQYGTFARTIAEKLGYVPPQHGKSAPCWWFTLSTARASDNGATDAQVEWVMRPELVSALRTMKWA